MKKYLDVIINIIFIFILNITLSILIFNNLTILSTIFYLLESIIFGSIIKLISSISKNNKLNKTISIISLILIGIIFTAQFVHYSFYECFFSFFSLLNGGQVFGFLEAIIKVIIENITKFLLFIILIIIQVFLVIKTPFYKEKTKNIILISSSVLSIILIILLVTFLKTGLYSQYNLMYNTHNQTQNVRNFGLLTSMTTDIERYIFKFEPKLIIKEQDIKNTNNKEYNITNIDFDNLIENEKDETIKNLHKYFKNEFPTNKNEYTGIFKGKNLIFITAESFNFNIINKETTPTLYKIKNEGISFTNFYTPIYYASTSDGEYTNLTGLLPQEGTWSYIKSKNNYYPYTYANIFDNLNYKTYAYHNGEYNFYNRHEVLPNLGYKNYKACNNGLEKYINCNLWPQSDEEMFKETFKDYKNTPNFSVYYMSISGHLSHNFKTNDMAKKWQKNIENLNYSENIKAYISGNIDLDKALESLLNNLEKENLLEDTVIVITPDHFPYGLNKKEISELQKLETNYDLHKSGLIIYNKTTKHKEINTLSSNIDILPTLLNMFGIEYDSRLIIGKDIMSDTDKIVIFNDRSFLTKEGYYDAKKDTFSNKNINKNYINEKKLEVYNKVNASSNILNKNYYEKIKTDNPSTKN